MKTLLISALALVSAGLASAQSYTYFVENSKTTITGFSAEPSGAIVIPTTLGGGTVTGIDRSAFKDRTGITGISFASGSSVVNIGVMAFQGCTGLQSVALPSGVTSVPAAAFQGCAALNSVSLPATVTGIGGAAFSGCTSLSSLTLPTGLTSLGEGVFIGCRGLTSLAIPTGVTELPGNLFADCRSLAGVTMGDAVTSIGASSFSGCGALPSFIIPAAVTSIGADAFRECAGMTSITLNSALVSLGARVFDDCASLASISVSPANASFSANGGVLFNKDQTALFRAPENLSGAYAIPTGVIALTDGAFSHCDALTAVTFPATLGIIPEDAFYYAAGLTTVDLPSAVTTIGSWAFAGCAGLEGVTFPTTLTSLGNDAFHHATNLSWALFNGNAPAIGTNTFDHTASGFAIYYYPGRSGWSTPAWSGYPASPLTAPGAIVTWLTDMGYSPGTSLTSDADNDGVNLLLAYALGLDPSQNLSASLPQPALSADALSITFKGNSDSVIYSVETSTDLQTWTTTGVTLSAADTNGQRTGSVATDPETAKFLRLVVGY